MGFFNYIEHVSMSEWILVFRLICTLFSTCDDPLLLLYTILCVYMVYLYCLMLHFENNHQINYNDFKTKATKFWIDSKVEKQIYTYSKQREKNGREWKKNNTQTTDRHIMLIWNLVEQWEWPITGMACRCCNWNFRLNFRAINLMFLSGFGFGYFTHLFATTIDAVIKILIRNGFYLHWKMALYGLNEWAWFNIASKLQKSIYRETIKIENWNSSNNKTNWHFSRYSISNKQKQSLNPASDAPFYGVVYVRWEQSKAKLNLIYCIAEIQTALMFSSQLIEWLMQIWSPEMKQFEAHFSDVFIWSCSSSLNSWCHKKWFYCFHQAAVLCRKINRAIIHNKCFIRAI